MIQQREQRDEGGGTGPMGRRHGAAVVPFMCLGNMAEASMRQRHVAGHAHQCVFCGIGCQVAVQPQELHAFAGQP